MAVFASRRMTLFLAVCLVFGAFLGIARGKGSLLAGFSPFPGSESGSEANQRAGAESSPEPGREHTEDFLQLASSAAESMLRDRFLCLVDGDTSRLKRNYQTSTSSGNWAWEREVYRVEYFQDWASKRGVEIVKADSEFEIDAVSRQGDGSIWVEVTELATYSYVYADDQLGLEFTFGSRALHAMEIVKSDGQWVICMDWYLDPLGEGFCITASGLRNYGDLEAEGSPSQGVLSRVWPALPPLPALHTLGELDAPGVFHTLSSSSASKPSASSSLSPDSKDKPRFDRIRAAEYALAHSGVRSIPGAGKYNRTYRIYTYAGGDCASFVSQVLRAGGMEEGYGWHYTTEGSTAWVRSDGLIWYLLSSGRGEMLYRGKFPKALEPSPEYPQGVVGALEPGDIIAYEIKEEIGHVAAVISKDPRGYVTIASHTADRLYFPWDLGWDRDTMYWFIKVTY